MHLDITLVSVPFLIQPACMHTLRRPCLKKNLIFSLYFSTIFCTIKSILAHLFYLCYKVTASNVCKNYFMKSEEIVNRLPSDVKYLTIIQNDRCEFNKCVQNTYI